MKLFFSRLTVMILIVVVVSALAFVALGSLLLSGSPEFWHILRTVVGFALAAAGIFGIAGLTVALCRR